MTDELAIEGGQNWTPIGGQYCAPFDRQGFAIVARELLGPRPLEEIGLMRAIADTTLAIKDLQVLLGTRDAA